MQGIKEISEVFEFGQALVDDLVKAKADGSVSIADLLGVFSANTAGAFKAYSGLSEVKDELGDLSPEETRALAGMGIDLAKKLLDLVKPQV